MHQNIKSSQAEYINLDANVAEEACISPETHFAYKTLLILTRRSGWKKTKSFTISHAEIAKKIGKSIKTVIRHIAALVKAGYLTVTKRYKQNGYNLPNTYHVHQIQKKPKIVELPPTAEPITPIVSELSGRDIDVPHKTTSKDLQALQEASINNITKLSSTESEFPNESQEIVVNDCVNEQEIMHFEDDEKSLELKRRRALAEADIKRIDAEAACEVDWRKRHDIENEAREIVGELHRINLHIEAWEKQKQKELDAKLRPIPDSGPVKHDVKHKPFSDKVKRYVPNWLEGAVTKINRALGYRPHEIAETYKCAEREIISGSLSKNYDGTEKSIEHACNIVLKLMRELRWVNNKPKSDNKPKPAVQPKEYIPIRERKDSCHDAQYPEFNTPGYHRLNGTQAKGNGFTNPADYLVAMANPV